jgi:hypothetical protein
MQGHKKTTNPMSIYCSTCRGKHLLMEFTLNQVDIYEICEKTHATSSCKLPTRIKNNLKKPTIEEEELNYVGHRSQNIGYNAH